MTDVASAIETATAANAVAAFGNCTATLAGTTVAAVFIHGFAESFDVDGEVPTLLVQSSDASGTVRGTAAIVNGVSYTVQGIEPDGTGMTMLLLEEV